MAAIAQIRRFNRAVTQQIGALEERFLGRDRSLGASRLLFEIGPNGMEVRQLRAILQRCSSALPEADNGGPKRAGAPESAVRPGRRFIVESPSRAPTTRLRLRPGSRGAVAPRECRPPPRGEPAESCCPVLSQALLRRARRALRGRIRSRPRYSRDGDGANTSAGVFRPGNAAWRPGRMRCAKVPSRPWGDQAHVGRPGVPRPGDWETYLAAARGLGAETARTAAPARDQQGPDRGASPLPEQRIPRGAALQ